jgi:hypothetical protein
MKLNPGVGYTSANLGEASGLTIDAGVESSARNIGRQFECSITGAKVGESYEYRLHVRKGLVEFDYYTSDEKGIIDLDSLGGIGSFNRQNMFFYINKFNLFPNGSLTEGTEEASEFISKNGFIKLTPENDYFVFLYKTTPDWKDSNDLWEAKAPQLGISKAYDDPNIYIRTQRNGGGFLQSYIRLDGASTTDNVVVADTIGRIASLDTAGLNSLVTFHVEELLVTDNNDANYPASMTSWLANNVPIFAEKSTNPNLRQPDGMTIDGVPSAVDDVNFTRYVDGGEFGAWYYNMGGLAYGAGNTNEQPPGNFNWLMENVVRAKDVGTLYGYTVNPLVSGLIAPEDAFRIRVADYTPTQPPVIEFEGGIEIKADNTTQIKTVGEMTDAGTGYVTTDCYRQDIAYIKWNAGLNRFQIYQIQYGVIHLRQNPLGSFKNKLLTSPTQIAKWDTGFDLCSQITASLSGYTKDLNHAYYVPPAPAQQIPAYAGDVAIGDYQSPKETL